MTFYELYETIDDKIEKSLKNSNDWCWENDRDFNTNEWKNVAKCYIDDGIFCFLKKAGISLQDKFYVNGIGELELKYSTQFAKYYVELIEKANIEIMLT